MEYLQLILWLLKEVEEVEASGLLMRGNLSLRMKMN